MMHYVNLTYRMKQLKHLFHMVHIKTDVNWIKDLQKAGCTLFLSQNEFQYAVALLLFYLERFKCNP